MTKGEDSGWLETTGATEAKKAAHAVIDDGGERGGERV
jgi:hypothetical protein